MINIEIEIDSKKQSFNHAESFNELLPHQLKTIVEIFILNKNSLNDRVPDKIMLLESLLRASEKKTEKKKTFKIIDNLVDDGVLDELLKLQGFLYKEQDFNRWIIKVLRHNKSFFYGRQDYFSYMLFGEFIVTDMFFMNYFESEDEKTLNKFIAVLFRNKKENFDIKSKGDVRETFNSEFLDYRTEQLSSLDNITKQSVLFNYASVRYWLTKKYPNVFGSSESKENKKSIEFGNNNSGWMNIRRNLAGDVFNLEKTDNLLLSDVLNDLNEKMSK